MSVALRKDVKFALPGEPDELSTKDFEVVASLVHEASGIQLNDRKRGLVKSRLQNRLRTLQLSAFAEYVAYVQSSEGHDELEELICAISTNVTSFDREPHHFEHFRGQVLPGLIEKLKRGQSVRLWSAGCSNGSEAYTLAFSVIEAFPDVSRADFLILATDIDKYSLAAGQQGIYSEDLVSKLSSKTIQNGFEAVEGGYQVSERVRSLVRFKYLNLMEPWPLRRNYEVIFCRNVLIYFSQERQTTLFSQFADRLVPGGHFYIGHSERVIGPANSRFSSIGLTTYQLEDERRRV